MPVRTDKHSILVLLARSPALAAPKGAPAKKEFDRGVKAYTAGNYEGAADAMGKSYGLEKDPETLFAWAQAERKLEDCDKAIELYNELLGLELPAENKQVIDTQIERVQADHRRQAEAPPSRAPVPAAPEHPIADEPAPPPPAAEGSRAWWKDPIGDGLVIAGVAGLVVGGVKLSSAASADSEQGATRPATPTSSGSRSRPTATARSA